MNSILRSSKFWITIILIVLCTIALILRPEINEYFKSYKEANENQVGSEFAEKIGKVLEDLPTKSFDYANNALYFKMLNGKKQFFIGTDSYQLLEVRGQYNIKLLGIDEVSGKKAFKDIKTNYKLDIKEEEVKNIGVFSKKINAPISQKRIDAIEKKIGGLKEKDAFLSVLYNSTVDGNSKSFLTVVENGKLKEYQRNDFYFDMVDQEKLKKYIENIKSDESLHKKYYEQLASGDSLKNLNALNIPEEILNQGYQPTYIYYNYRNDCLHFSNSDSINLNTKLRTFFKSKDDKEKMKEFLNQSFKLPKALLKMKVGGVEGPRLDSLKTCFNSPFDDFNNVIKARKSQEVPSAFAEYLRAYMYGQESNPYAFLIHDQKLYTLKDFLDQKINTPKKPLLLDVGEINKRIETIQKEFSQSIKSGNNKYTNMDGLEKIFFVCIGMLTLLLIGYLIYVILNHQKFNANLEKLKRLKKQIADQNEAIQQKQVPDPQKNKDNQINEDPLWHFERFLDFILSGKNLKPSILGTIFGISQLKEIELENNKKRLKKGLFHTYNVPDKNGNKIKNFEIQTNHNDQSRALQLNESTFVLINKYGELYEDENSNSEFAEIKLEGDKWHVKSNKENDSKLEEVLWTGERKLNQYFDGLYESCKEKNITSLFQIRIDKQTKNRDVIFRYADNLEQTYDALIPKLKISSFDSGTVNSLIEDIIELIHTGGFSKIKLDKNLKSKVEEVSNYYIITKTIEEIAGKNNIDVLEKQKQITNLLNKHLNTNGNQKIHNKLSDFLDSDKYKNVQNSTQKIRNILSFIEKQEASYLNNKNPELKSTFEALLAQESEFNKLVEIISDKDSKVKKYSEKEKVKLVNEFSIKLFDLKSDLKKDPKNFENFKKIIDLLLTKPDEEGFKDMNQKFEKLLHIDKKIFKYYDSLKDTKNIEFISPDGFKRNFYNLILASNTLNQIINISRIPNPDLKQIDIKGFKKYLIRSLISNVYISDFMREEVPKPIQEADRRLNEMRSVINNIPELSNDSKVDEEIKRYHSKYSKYYQIWKKNQALENKYDSKDIEKSMDTFKKLIKEYETSDETIKQLLSNHRKLKNYISIIDKEYVVKFYDMFDTEKSFKNYNDFAEFISVKENRKLLTYLMEFVLHSYNFIQNVSFHNSESENNYQLLKNNFKITDDIEELKKGFRAGWMDGSSTLSNQIYYLSKILSVEELRVLVNNYIIMPWDEDSRKINERD